MNILIDVGAYDGESSKIGVELFDHVHAFEPSWRMFQIMNYTLSSRANVTLYPLGWWHVDAVMMLHNGGNVGASVFRDKPKYERDTARVAKDEPAFFVRASRWVSEHLRSDDDNYLKLNCEGAECAILADLLASGEIKKFKRIAVDFDAEKIPLQAARVPEVRRMLKAAGVDYFDAGAMERPDVIHALYAKEAAGWR